MTIIIQITLLNTIKLYAQLNFHVMYIKFLSFLLNVSIKYSFLLHVWWD